MRAELFHLTEDARRVFQPCGWLTIGEENEAAGVPGQRHGCDLHPASIKAIEEVGGVSGGDAVDIGRNQLRGCDVLCGEHDIDIFLKGDNRQDVGGAHLRNDVLAGIPHGRERLTIH